MKQLLINLYGGPGTGKSTTAAHVFAELKWRGVSSELVTEYAKDLTWQESFKVRENQLYIFGKQQQRLTRLKDKVKIIVTDSPLLMGLHYGADNTSDLFKQLVIEENSKFESLDFFLVRKKAYDSNGRTQTETEARDIDVSVRKILHDLNVPYIELPGEKESVSTIVELALHKYNKICE